MKRVACCVVVAWLTACGNSQGATPVRLSGVVDVALVGTLLFTNSANTGELRVLDLTTTPFRDFVRAPNPLEPLSIPVTDRPVELVRDVHFASDAQGNPGVLFEGPYVYARSGSLPEISVVDSSLDTGLREVYRFKTEGTVTALVARGSLGGDDPSVLYFATVSGADSILWQAKIKPVVPPATTPETPAPPTQIALISGEQIAALEVVGTEVGAPHNDTLAVGTRAGSGLTGSAFVLDVATGTRGIDLKFPVPVRKLLVNPGFARRPESGGGTYNAGRLVFGVLDESSCVMPVRPCAGVLAVDRAPTDPSRTPGDVALDVTGYPMQPVEFGRGLVQGFALGVNVPVQEGTSTPTPPVEPLLGIVSTSTDKFLLFDAANLRAIDSNPAPALVTRVQIVEADGGVIDRGEGIGPTTVAPSEGITRDEDITITNEGVIPGLVGLPYPGPGTVVYPVADPVALARAEVGDIVQYFDSSSAACADERRVTARDTAAATLTVDAAPTGCVPATFSVRASGSQPFVVNATVSGYLGRMQAGPTTGTANPVFVPQSSHPAYFHADGYSESSPGVPAAPLVAITMGPSDPSFVRDWAYVITTAMDFQQLFFSVDTATYFPGATLPGPITVFQGSTAVPQVLVFVAFLSNNEVMEFRPATIIPSVLLGPGSLNFYPGQ